MIARLGVRCAHDLSHDSIEIHAGIMSARNPPRPTQCQVGSRPTQTNAHVRSAADPPRQAHMSGRQPTHPGRRTCQARSHPTQAGAHVRPDPIPPRPTHMASRHATHPGRRTCQAGTQPTLANAHGKQPNTPPKHNTKTVLPLTVNSNPWPIIKHQSPTLHHNATPANFHNPSVQTRITIRASQPGTPPKEGKPLPNHTPSLPSQTTPIFISNQQIV